MLILPYYLINNYLIYAKSTAYLIKTYLTDVNITFLFN